MNALGWLVPWQPSLIVPLCLAVSALIYARGCLSVRQTILHQIGFWTGWLGFYAVNFTHLDYYAEHAFFMHRLQHVVLHHLSPILIVLARPGAALMAGLPGAGRDGLRRLGAWRPVNLLLAFFNQPFVAVVLFSGLVIFWLIPPVHFIAMLDVRLYKLMNWGMAINGLMFWGLVLNNCALRPAALSVATRLIMVVAIIPPQIVTGLVLLMAGRDLYPVYSLCGRVFGLSPLADQQLGGVILWLSGAMMSVMACLVIIVRSRPAWRAGP